MAGAQTIILPVLSVTMLRPPQTKQPDICCGHGGVGRRKYVDNTSAGDRHMLLASSDALAMPDG
jgi:hypothetical protein